MVILTIGFKYTKQGFLCSLGIWNLCKENFIPADLCIHTAPSINMSGSISEILHDSGFIHDII